MFANLSSAIVKQVKQHRDQCAAATTDGPTGDLDYGWDSSRLTCSNSLARWSTQLSTNVEIRGDQFHVRLCRHDRVVWTEYENRTVEIDVPLGDPQAIERVVVLIAQHLGWLHHHPLLGDRP